MRDYASELPVILDADLFSAGWNGTKTPYPGINEKQFAFQSLRNSILKKYQDGISTDADSSALSLFLSVNEKCRSFSLDHSALFTHEEVAIGEAKDFIYRTLNVDGLPAVNLSSISSNFGLGSGSNIGSRSNDFLSKVGTSTMAATGSVLHMLFTQAISDDPIWSVVESNRSKTKGHEIVQGSRLSFVPKTRNISRTICTEPLCNMLFQKGIGSVLEQLLRKVSGINLTYQPDKNRKLAQLGSQNGRFGTIDLSSASDSMSRSLVKEFFPSEFVTWLDRTRSPVTILPDGTTVELHMVSSMGNAFTFPLQTLFFLSLVYGAYRALGIHPEFPYGQSLGNLAVFGDDIIVECKAYDLTVRLLMLCGFSVNVDKSFNEGFFRESCGRDYYCGYNVRGVYIKTLSNTCDRYSAINRLNVWSATHSVPLTRTISYLIKGCRFLPIPFDEMDIAGIKVPLRSLKNRQSHRFTGGILYRFVDVVSADYSVADVTAQPPKLRDWFNNHEAVLLAALAGTVRRGKVVARVSRRLTRIRRRYSSRWDYIVTDQGVSPGFGERWKSFVELNLNLF